MFANSSSLAALPDELILHVISFLNSQPYPRPGPFTQWSSLVNEQIQPASSQLRDAQSLALCNKRLLNVTSSAKTHFLVIGGRENRPLCLTRLKPGRISPTRLATIFVDCKNTYNVHDLFRLPSIHTLTIKYFDGSLYASPRYHEMAGQSCVKILRLVECVRLGRTLADLLSLPAALREFWYSSNVEGWNDNKSDVSRVQSTMQDGTPRSHFLFETAIAKQRTSLEKLVVSRLSTSADRIVQGNLFDLRQFRNLRSLCIDHCDMLDKFFPEDVWRRLPPNLEELEAAYNGGKDTIKVYEKQKDPRWLFLLLDSAWKLNYAPSLARIRMLSVIWSIHKDILQVESGKIEIDDAADANTSWQPPREWIQRCQDVGVSFSSFAGSNRQFRAVVDSDQRFPVL